MTTSKKAYENSSLNPNEQLRSFGKSVQKKVNIGLQSMSNHCNFNAKVSPNDVEDNVNYVLGYN